MYIVGTLRDAEDGQRFDSVNPSTEDVWENFPDAVAADVDRAVKTTQYAFTETKPVFADLSSAPVADHFVMQ